MRFLRALVRETIKDDIPDLGAMLAYYAVLSLFPMVLFIVSLALLVLPQSVLDQGVAMAAQAMPEAARPILVDRVQQLIHATSSGFAITGALLALWGASRGAAALGTALDRLFEKKETRSWIKRQLIAIAVTVVVAVLMITALGLLVVGPVVGHWLTDRFGLGATFDTVWSIGRWVGAGLLVMLLWAIVYKFLPDTDAPFRVFTPGAAIGVLLWLALSWVFGLYLQHAGSYEATYGTLGGAIIFLTWLWLSNITMLLGAEINDVLADFRKHDSPAAAKLAQREVPSHGAPALGS
jgi:membrane protein